MDGLPRIFNKKRSSLIRTANRRNALSAENFFEKITKFVEKQHELLKNSIVDINLC